jgi:UDP-N-acetylglucosamine:LPS N-acetylglucosamine transferase
MPKKDLILDFIYSDAGGGHRSAALALHEAVTAEFPHWTINMINLFQDVLRPIDPVHRLTRVRRSEDIYNSMLKSGRTYGFTTMLRVMQKMIQWHRLSIEAMLRQSWKQKSRPDLVVSLIPHFNQAMLNSLHAVYPGVPFVTIMTDLADYPPRFWQETQNQFIICGSEKAVTQAQIAGYADNKILKTSGMILKPTFYQDYTTLIRHKERQKRGLPPDAVVALIMFGGHGAKTAEKIVGRLNRLNPRVYSIVMCGHNDKLRKRLDKKKTCVPVGFTTDTVSYYMWLADFFIGKPGPGSLSEAVHMGLPVIVERNSRTMPQERYNTEWVQEKNLGIVVKSFAHIASAVRLLLKDNRLALFQQSTRQMKNAAIYEIPDLLERILARTEKEQKRA